MSNSIVQAFPLSFAVIGQQPVQISATAIAVNFSMNDQVPTLRAYTDPSAPTTRNFTIFGDGQTVPSNGTYVGTVQYQQSFFHLFETP